MEYKCKNFTINGKFINIVIKKPLFKKVKEIISYYDYKFKDNNEKYLGCVISKNGEIILTFVLRDYESDIKPYIENENRKEDK